MSVDKRLAQFLKGVKDRERRATSLPGLFLFKSPLIVVEQREKDRLAEAITDDVVKIFEVEVEKEGCHHYVSRTTWELVRRRY